MPVISRVARFRGAIMNTKIAKSSQLIIAALGLLGVIITGTLSNWDKLFGNVVEAKYSGYRPTGTFETELRYYFEVSGARNTIEAMQAQLLKSYKDALVSKHPTDSAEILSLIDRAAKEAPTLDDVIREFVPLYQKYFTLQELQELNKFCSTEIMQGMVKNMPLLVQEAAPLQANIPNDYLERLSRSRHSQLSD